MHRWWLLSGIRQRGQLEYIDAAILTSHKRPLFTSNVAKADAVEHETASTQYIPHCQTLHVIIKHRIKVWNQDAPTWL